MVSKIPTNLVTSISVTSRDIEPIDCISHLFKGDNHWCHVVEHKDGSLNIITDKNEELYDGSDWKQAAKLITEYLS